MSVPDPAQGALANDLLSVLAKHGVGGLPAAASAPARSPDIEAIGAYITQIITGAGDKAFDPAVLAQVTRTLQEGTGKVG